jgi:hypothetical protein
MNGTSFSVTSVTRRMGQSLAGDSTIIRFLQKARRNSAAVIISHIMNSLA